MKSHFKKMTPKEVNIIFSAMWQNCKLTMKSPLGQKTVRVKLVLEPQDLQKIYVLPLQLANLKGQDGSFSFNVGTQMCFFKAKLKSNSKGFYVDADQDFFELARRRDIRFETNQKYPVDCQIILSKDGKAKAPAYMINLSNSGVSVLADAVTGLIRKGKELSIYLKPDKKSGFSVKANVKYFKIRQNELTEVGLEFVDLDDNQKNKIATICDDLSRFIFAI